MAPYSDPQALLRGQMAVAIKIKNQTKPKYWKRKIIHKASSHAVGKTQTLLSLSEANVATS